MQQNLIKILNNLQTMQSLSREIGNLNYLDKKDLLQKLDIDIDHPQKSGKVISKFIEYLVEKGKVKEAYLFIQLHLIKVQEQILELKIKEELDRIGRLRPEMSRYIKEFIISLQDKVNNK